MKQNEQEKKLRERLCILYNRIWPWATSCSKNRWFRLLDKFETDVQAGEQTLKDGHNVYLANNDDVLAVWYVLKEWIVKLLY